MWGRRASPVMVLDLEDWQLPGNGSSKCPIYTLSQNMRNARGGGEGPGDDGEQGLIRSWALCPFPVITAMPPPLSTPSLTP